MRSRNFASPVLNGKSLENISFKRSKIIGPPGVPNY